jgi:hypothetical protein
MAYELAVIYQHGGRPLRLARIRDHRLLVAAASAAVAEAEREAVDLARHDAVLGRVQMAEAQKLRQVLEPIIGPPPRAA